MRSRNVVLMALVAIGGCQCDEDGVTDPCEVLVALCKSLETVPVYVDAASPTSQTGLAGQAVADPPAARVTTDAGPASGCLVNFQVNAGDGLVLGPPPFGIAPGTASALVSSDGNGIAKLAAWQLGPASGPNRVVVSSVSCTSLLAPSVQIRSGTFQATAVDPTPAEIIKVDGDEQAGAAGGTASPSPRVRVLGAQSLPLPNTAVTFTVLSGGGTVSGAIDASAATDADGYATAPTWVFGPVAGVNYLQASVTGLLPVVFEAVTSASAPMRVTAASSPAGSPGQQASPRPAVTVTDAFDNPVPGVAVEFAVTAGGGAVATTTAMTDATGTATADWTFGTAAGLNRLVATVLAGGQPDTQIQGNPVSFDVTTVAAGAIEVFVSHYGEALVGVNVAIAGTATAQAVTDANGIATFENLAPGPYTVTITPPAGVSFTSTAQAVIVVVNQTVSIEFQGYGAPPPPGN